MSCCRRTRFFLVNVLGRGHQQMPAKKKTTNKNCLLGGFSNNVVVYFPEMKEKLLRQQWAVALVQFWTVACPQQAAAQMRELRSSQRARINHHA